MQDDEQSGSASTYDSESATDRTSPNSESGTDAAGAADADGWQHYRKWISSAPAPRSRRGSLDPALYTWKGYRNWTEQVKRNWSDS